MEEEKIKEMKIKFTFLRYAIYAILTYVLLEVMRLDAEDTTQIIKFSESSIVEQLQNVFLLISIIFIAKAKDFSAVRYGLLMILGLFFIREQDAFLDNFLGKHAWKVMCGGYALAIGYKIYSSRSKLKTELEKFINTASAGIIFIGLTTLLIFSRMFGRKVFWMAIEGTSEYTRNVKNAAEECTELFAYFLILIGAVEFYVFAYSMVKKQTMKFKNIKAS